MKDKSVVLFFLKTIFELYTFKLLRIINTLIVKLYFSILLTKNCQIIKKVN